MPKRKQIEVRHFYSFRDMFNNPEMVELVSNINRGPFCFSRSLHGGWFVSWETANTVDSEPEDECELSAH